MRRLAGAVLLCLCGSVYGASWTPLSRAAPQGIGTMLLLTDGTVMAQSSTFYDTWFRLTPSSTGSYADGTWTELAPMRTPRLYFASEILPDGRVWVLGGEYSGRPLQQNITNTGEIYDPGTDSWTPSAPHPEASFGDDPSMLLPGGTVLAGSIFTSSTWLYDIASDSWRFAASKVYGDRSDEEGWVKLPDGRVLSYDLFWSVSTGGSYAETYDPAANVWRSISPSDHSATGFIPQLSSSTVGYELGPMLRLRGRGAGKVFIVGATGHTALYDIRRNDWQAGPDVMGLLNGASGLFGTDDGPAAVLPDGRVLFVADASPTTHRTYSAPSQLFLYDPVSNAIQPTAPPSPLTPTLAVQPAFVFRLLVLPTGEVLMSVSGAGLWIYTPDGTADPRARPRIDAIRYDGGGQYTLTGRNLNGQSAGAAYGDDVENDENYPLVRITSETGNVLYGRTFGWSSTGIDVRTGESVRFTLNPSTTPGWYRLETVGAGIASEPVCLFLPAPDRRRHGEEEGPGIRTGRCPGSRERNEERELRDR